MILLIFFLLQILGEQAEASLVKYLLQCNDMYFGLSPKEVRGLAFDMAKKLEIKTPDSWQNSKMAGEDWLSGFLKRHKDISIRKPEATSLARATSFNRHNVGAFFGKLKIVLDRENIIPQNIYNMDETGVTTVQTPDRIIGRCGSKQVGRVVSGERGTLVTLAAAISAVGNSVPPFFIFPRKKFQTHFITSGPIGCGGAANPSGWMTADIFPEYLKFFQSHVRATIANSG